jgi:hypothetical protein
VTQLRAPALDDRPVAFTASKFSLSFSKHILTATREQRSGALVHHSRAFMGNRGALMASLDPGHRTTLRARG